MENLTGGTPPVRYLPCVVPCKLYFTDIQIYEEEQDKQIIKSIGFKFPVFYDGEFTKRIIRDKEKTVETVVLMQYCGK